MGKRLEEHGLRPCYVPFSVWLAKPDNAKAGSMESAIVLWPDKFSWVVPKTRVAHNDVGVRGDSYSQGI